MFPVWRRSSLLLTKSWVYPQLIDGQAKAYPLSVLKDELVVNDTLAGQNLVVIHEDGGLGARAYDRGKHTFVPTAEDTTGTLLDETGNRWQVTENALINEQGEELARLPAHVAYWFGWFSFYPRTEVCGFEGE